MGRMQAVQQPTLWGRGTAAGIYVTSSWGVANEAAARLKAQRQLQWEQQVCAPLSGGRITVEDVRGYLPQRELIRFEEQDPWDQVSTAKGLRAWLFREVNAGRREPAK
jgi:hypothetical protein